MDTKQEKILKEIESVETKTCGDGLSFMDKMEHEGHLSNIERLLFFTPDNKKYYYNFTEKLLRKIKVNPNALLEDLLSKDNKEHYLFECVDLDDEEDKFKISSFSFADKLICYEDFHKVVTFDEKKKFYECFYVDITEKAAKKFLKEVTVDNLKELEKHTSSLTKEDILDMDYASEGIDAICKFLIQQGGDVTGINITYDPNKKNRQLHIQITTSKWLDVKHGYDFSEDEDDD